MKGRLTPTIDEQEYIEYILQDETHRHKAKIERLLSCIKHVNSYTNGVREEVEQLGIETEEVRKTMVQIREDTKKLKNLVK